MNFLNNPANKRKQKISTLYMLVHYSDAKSQHSIYLIQQFVFFLVASIYSSRDSLIIGLNSCPAPFKWISGRKGIDGYYSLN